MTLKLTDKELLEIMEKELQQALQYHALKMYYCFVADFNKAFAYQSLYYSLGYSFDDLPPSITGQFDLCRSLIQKLVIKEI